MLKRRLKHLGIAEGAVAGLPDDMGRGKSFQTNSFLFPHIARTRAWENQAVYLH